ncbi:DUF6090 family protein [Congregibacter variabilis]|uniref:DUF6090 family protein n=1 Tax=Congregibacter variabilis TaxID=3081200 RepID=A0ABZ0I5A0_9GAMM|nr:DUF6090 family protein [Congregibacter sp. IMCC43200]
MIRFFSTIRYRLIDEGRASQYLGYAAGEVLLVILGILIALQINNWNETRKAVENSRTLLSEFRKDLATDVGGIERVVLLLQKSTEMEAAVLRDVDYSQADAEILRRVFLTTVHQEFIQDRTFKQLQNSPNPTMAGFPELQNQLTYYYTDQRFLMDWYNRQEEDFLGEFDTLDVLRQTFEVPLPNFPLRVSENEQNEILIGYAQTVAGRNFVKQNYLRRTAMIEIFGGVRDEAKALISQIDSQLDSED